MMFSKKEPKYKLYPVQKEEDLNIIHIGLYVRDDKYGGYDLKFAFETEAQAREFISTLDQYPKFVEVD